MRCLDLTVSLLCVLVVACGDDDRERLLAGDDAATARDGSTSDAAPGLPGMDAGDARVPDTQVPGDGGGSPFPVSDAGQVLCGSAPCACSDGVDNDMDGVFDLGDPECVSGWDNDESSLATGISGDNRDDACQDCFFDGNSGSGNDGCRIPSSCLTMGNASSGQGGCNSCTASDQCKNFCQAYTPNGCDCFGCCGVQVGSNITKNVLIGSGCNIDGNVFSGCTECVPSVSCVNTCGRCELCPGKTLADLPADCTSGVPVGGSDAGVPTPTCDEGEARCGAGLPACAGDQACSFGCCILVPLL